MNLRRPEGREVSEALLTVDDLRVAYPARGGGMTEVVRGVSFTLGRERLGIVGESGSGKSQTGRAILGLTAPGGVVTAKTLRLGGEGGGIDLLTCPPQQRRALRGGRIAMVLQDPKFSLDPVMRIGAQIEETLRAHVPVSAGQRRQRMLQALADTGIEDPARVARLYPHEVSGGMGQRAMIAMMLVAGPELLIADEPTSALDVTVQLQVLGVLDRLVRDKGMGLVFVSHDLRLVSSFCDRVLVMYAGRVVEEIAATELHRAQHPYTRGLLNCLPQLGAPQHPLPTLDRRPEWMAS
ncbi:MAG: peptide ABC transporter ATP-binding protein [Leptothrix sp. (in: Bacteria)]|nr:peptide ABC transporter ATP-binding protein [Leptothrix sp. (in: b-proteobacteria)]